MNHQKTLHVKCPYKSECPGCARINQPYSQQIRLKHREIVEVFKRLEQSQGISQPVNKIGDKRGDKLGDKLGDQIAPTIASTHIWGYRTSTKLCLDTDRFGRKIIGLYQRHSKIVRDIPTCPVHHPAINKALEMLFGQNREFAPAPFYDHQAKNFQKAKLKFITIRLSPDGKSLALLVSHTGVDRKVLEDWADQVDLTGTSLYEGVLTPEDGSLVIPHRARLLGGDKTMTYRLPSSGLTYQLTPSVFFQANGPMAELFINTVTKAIDGTAGTGTPQGEVSSDCLLDLYGGFGSYSFPLIKRFKQIWIVETNKAAIDAALAYQKSNPSNSNVSVCHQTVESFFADHHKPTTHLNSSVGEAITHCIVNPPRAGLGDEVARLVVDRLPQLRRLVYVSCHPESMIKDLRRLLKKGLFKIESIQPIDMFPQTEHVETVVTLVRAPRFNRA